MFTTQKQLQALVATPRNLRYALRHKLNPLQYSHIIDIRANSQPDFPVLRFEGSHLLETGLLEKSAIAQDVVLTYQDLHENGHRFAAALKKMGIGLGDTFSIIMYNYPEFVYLIAAASIIGAIAVPIDPRTRGHKLAHQIANSESKAVFITADLLHALDEVKERITRVERIYTIEKLGSEATGDTSKTYPIQAILDSPFRQLNYQKGILKSPLQIIYTSGTTGDPKGVTNDNFRFGIMGYLIPRLMKYEKNSVLYTGLSFTHGNAQGITLAPAIYGGRKAIISAKFTKSRLWDIARRYDATSFSMLGGVAAGIYNEPVKADDADNPIKQVISAGMPQAIWEDFEKRFNVQITEWYSTLEGGGITINPYGKGPIGSMGKPTRLAKMKVVDENDNECPPNVPGEVVARMVGMKTAVNYFNNPKASKEKTRGGWNRTGDIAHVDENGWWYFDHRKGDELRRNGDFIQPAIIEAVIGKHSDVSEVSVFGVPAATGAPGESDLVAAIVLFDGKERDPESIYKEIRRGLEANSIPSYLLFLDEIPMTISQKPQIRFLKQKFADEPNRVFLLADIESDKSIKSAKQNKSTRQSASA